MAYSTLLFQLSGPLQAWGVQSHFGVRDSGREPSKSGVIGLLCAALARPRHAPLDDLVSLKMGVRIDHEGRMSMDFHTAQNIYRADGKSLKDTEVSRRYYLEDARFLVGLEGEMLLLQELEQALRRPQWLLYLGRKAFVPGNPVWLPEGLRPEEDLFTALKDYPWLGTKNTLKPEQLRIVIEGADGFQVRPDVPLSFTERSFTTRRVSVDFVPVPDKRWEEAYVPI